MPALAAAECPRVSKQLLYLGPGRSTSALVRRSRTVLHSWRDTHDLCLDKAAAPRRLRLKTAPPPAQISAGRRFPLPMGTHKLRRCGTEKGASVFLGAQRTMRLKCKALQEGYLLHRAALSCHRRLAGQRHALARCVLRDPRRHTGTQGVSPAVQRLQMAIHEVPAYETGSMACQHIKCLGLRPARRLAIESSTKNIFLPLSWTSTAPSTLHGAA